MGAGAGDGERTAAAMVRGWLAVVVPCGCACGCRCGGLLGGKEGAAAAVALAHSLTHRLTHTFTHTLTHPGTHSRTVALALAQCPWRPRSLNVHGALARSLARPRSRTRRAGDMPEPGAGRGSVNVPVRQSVRSSRPRPRCIGLSCAEHWAAGGAEGQGRPGRGGAGHHRAGAHGAGQQARTQGV